MYLVGILTVIMLVYHFYGNTGFSKYNYIFPPEDQHDDCPDNWIAHMKGKSMYCKNPGKSANSEHPECQDMDKTFEGWSLEEKKEWADTCKVPWGGVENRYFD